MERNSKLQVWLPLLFSIVLILGMLLGYRMRDSIPGKKFFSVDKTSPLLEMMYLINNKYVDDVNLNQLTDTAYNAILAKLDPHSVYISAEDVQAANDDIAGNFFGIGVEFDIIDDTINVISVVPDGPSFKAGLLIGDKFIKVNDSLVAGIDIKPAQIRKLLRGGDKSNVEIDLLRKNKRQKIVVQRGIVSVSSIDAAYIIEDSIGFIRLNKFSQVSYKEFMESLENLQKQGLSKLILDLRSNGGGVLDQAVQMADEFLDGDKLITYTEGKHFPKKEYRCKRPGLYEKGDLIVLIDEGSASASEVLAGALQDWNRATIIGRRSFGKGLVQEQYDLSDGSALRLTIAKYYTPVGRSIQRPYTNGEKAYFDEVINRYEDGEVYSADSVKVDTTKKFKTPSGKFVYGGGGITPDVFVALNHVVKGEKAAKIFSSGVLPDFAYKYYIEHQTEFSQYKNAFELNDKFELQEEAWKRLVSMTTTDSIKTGNLSSREKEELLRLLKAYFARQIWRNNGFYQVINLTEQPVKMALEKFKTTTSSK